MGRRHYDKAAKTLERRKTFDAQYDNRGGNKMTERSTFI